MIKKRFDIKSEARLFAIKHHGSQVYCKGYPYIVHLEDVVRVLEHFGYTEDKYRASGYLHDTIEDTDASYNDIKKIFGSEIAEMVFAVTDELGRNRKEKHEKTYPKIIANPDSLIIKLADRIANLENGIYHKEYNYVNMYLGEYEEFQKMLRVDGVCDEMWKYIDDLFAEFKVFGV
jgi:(p)ppGpp synthase/HD superfamily hydrolase